MEHADERVQQRRAMTFRPMNSSYKQDTLGVLGRFTDHIIIPFVVGATTTVINNDTLVLNGGSSGACGGSGGGGSGSSTW